MKAIAVPNFGGPEVLRTEKVPLPQIRPQHHQHFVNFRKGRRGREHPFMSQAYGRGSDQIGPSRARAVRRSCEYRRSRPDRN
jgi:hypothetical protein